MDINRNLKKLVRISLWFHVCVCCCSFRGFRLVCFSIESKDVRWAGFCKWIVTEIKKLSECCFEFLCIWVVVQFKRLSNSVSRVALLGSLSSGRGGRTCLKWVVTDVHNWPECICYVLLIRVIEQFKRISNSVSKDPKLVSLPDRRKGRVSLNRWWWKFKQVDLLPCLPLYGRISVV